MTRRNRPTRNPQRQKGFTVRVERMLSQLADDATAAIVYMGTPRR